MIRRSEASLRPEARGPRPEARAEGAFTIIEMMVVIGIIGLLMGAAIFSVRSVTKADLRSAASRTAATFRFAFDRATMTGNTVLACFRAGVSVASARQRHNPSSEP